MTFIIATLVIGISFIVFFILFSNIFVISIFDIPATKKLGKKNIIKQESVLKKYFKVLVISSITTFSILFLSYYLFIKFSFGFSISLFIGAVLAFLSSLFKTILIFSRYSVSYLKWLDFYRKDNSMYLETMDIDIIDEALGGKPGELEKQTELL